MFEEISTNQQFHEHRFNALHNCLYNLAKHALLHEYRPALLKSPNNGIKQPDLSENRLPPINCKMYALEYVMTISSYASS